MPARRNDVRHHRVPEVERGHLSKDPRGEPFVESSPGAEGFRLRLSVYDALPTAARSPRTVESRRNRCRSGYFDGTRRDSIVVVQLVLALRVHALLTEALVPPAGCAHRHVVRAARVHPRQRDEPLEVLASARGTARRALSAHERLEGGLTALAEIGRAHV